MGKVKQSLWILLALILTAAGGLLPVAAARVQDAAVTNVARYEDMEALRLKLEEEVLSVTYPEKMSLIMHGAAMEITDENTKIKENQVAEAAYTALLPYMELFLGCAFDNDYMEFYPVAVYDENDPSRYACYWHVTVSLDRYADDRISLILDDETGKILALEMINPELYIKESYLQELLSALSACYLNELALSPAGEWPLAVAPENVDKGMPVAAAQYEFADETVGRILVEIGVSPDGFYIYPE